MGLLVLLRVPFGVLAAFLLNNFALALPGN